MRVVDAIGHAVSVAGAMGWEILWALILGFTLSAVVQAVVRKSEIVRLMPDDSPRSLAIATALGTASSSCSYAAVALARSLFRKGANFTAAMAFEIASTNLVVELGIVMALLLGWQFTLAEFVGGPIMIILMAVLLRVFLRRRLLDEARAQAEKALAGSMEGHAAMDMSVQQQGSLWARITSPAGLTSISEYFVMDWAAVIRDIAIGLLLAGAIDAWVPKSFFRHFFITSHPLLAKIWGPLIAPAVSVVSFVCSIGNVPLAAVLWNSGISFGGVISFVFADLIILPILNIYRKYYGAPMAAFIFAAFYATMVAAGYLVEGVFAILGLVPSTRNAKVLDAAITFNYTSVLNVFFLLLAAGLVIRFIRTGGWPMLKMMGGAPEPPSISPETGR
jgi:uncharacterized membrane protein YraQ (UPF0718 family)